MTKEGKIMIEQKALAKCKFGREADWNTLDLTLSDMNRETGYLCKVVVSVGGVR